MTINPPHLYIVATIAALVAWKWVKGSRRPPLPPGPTNLPLIGSVLSIPQNQQEWITFTQWKEQFGPINYFNVFGRDYIVLNTPKAVNDILLTRGANYSDRPKLEMVGPLTGYDRITAFSPYGERVRQSRKMLQPILVGRGVHRWHPQMEVASLFLMQGLLGNPQELYNSLLLYAARLVLKISHGYDVVTPDDKLVRIAERSLAQIGHAFELGRFMVEFFPFLKHVPDWFPGTGWKQTAAEYKASTEEMVYVPYEMVKRQLRDGTAQSSFSADLLEEADLSGQQEEMIQWSAHAIYAGGTDTSVAGVGSFFLAMTMFPHVQKKGQKEIDMVIGRSRLPTGGDRESLPYVSAIVKEVLRMYPVAPIALPHAATEDDIYEGYHIPKGSTVFGNSYAMLHDPEVYPDPWGFKPERFLGPEGNPDPKEYGAFGYGRRRCPAIDFAEESMFILFALFLWGLEIRPKKDANGNDIKPEGKYQHRIIPHPKPFPYDIYPRSDQAADTIRRACEAQTCYNTSQ